MNGKEFVFRGVLARYLDEGPLEIKKNFVIYARIADAVIFKEFAAPVSPAASINQSILRHASYMPTKGKESRALEIENALRRECTLKGRNLIELSYPDVHAEFEMIKIHLEKVYGKGFRKSYVFVEGSY